MPTKEETYEAPVKALDVLPGDPPQYLVDHRYANSQIRFRLLQIITTDTMTLDEVATKSGLTKEHLTSICLGKSGVTYLQMADLAKALFGEQTELRVIMPWVECGLSCSEEDACAEDGECQRLLEIGHDNGTVPEKVWNNA